jgi:cobalt-zinc-cadmium efflux system outer membrane protein
MLTNEGRLGLDYFEQMALQNHPTLAQAAAAVRAASGRTLQAGLYPNPVIGVTGDENTPGPVIRGGEFGGFVEQRIVTAGKLGLARRVSKEEEHEAEAALQIQRRRVLNAVRILYYETLGAQERVAVQAQLSALADEAVKISKELANVGAADQPDVLEAEIEAERAGLSLSKGKTALQRSWRELAAVVGNPSLPMAQLEGNLEATPRLELEQALAKLFEESPEIRQSDAMIAREEAALRRAKKEKIPDIQARGGLRYNRELLELDGQPVGLEGFFDVGVEIPFFNRNQGNIATASANLERAQREADRIRLSLRLRMAKAYQVYEDSRNMTEKYSSEMIPRAKKAYELYLNSFRQMAAAYPQVLIAQRNLFQLQDDYITALVDNWRSAVEIDGLLLSGGMELPSLSGAEIVR